MPARRASATSHAPALPSGRLHRSNGSSHSVVQAAMVSQATLYPGSSGTPATPQQKIVGILVSRLKNKLPCYSGMSLPDLENDDAIQQTVESLVDISRESLDIVAWALTELLDKLHKNTDSSGFRIIEVLQSQLFILKVLSIAMASRWSRRTDAQKAASLSKKASTISTLPDSPGPSIGSSRSRQPSNEQLGSYSQSAWIEPPAIDENCAKYVLSVMLLFQRQAASTSQGLMSAANLNFNASYHDMESVEPIEVTTYLDIFHTGPAIPPSIGSYYAKSEPQAKLPNFMKSHPPVMPSIRTTMRFPHHTISYERTSSVLCNSGYSMNTLIAKFAGRIVYHLSASNWSVVFSRIKSKIHFLASGAEDDAEVVDLQLMAYCWLDRYRLVQLLQELSSLLVNMKREAQAAIASPLRIAIWNWLVNHEEEFNDALLHYRRLESTPGRVFDLLYQLVDFSDKAAVWPTLTILMSISADRLKTDVVNVRNTSRAIYGRRDRDFAAQVLRSLANPPKGPLWEVTAVCALDLCRAASRVRPNENGDLPLQSIAYDVAHDIKNLILKWGGGSKPFWEYHEDIDIALVSDALVTIFRFLDESESVPIIMSALQPERSYAVKTAAIKACIALVTESTRIPWQRRLENLRDQVAKRIFPVFFSCVTQRAEVDENGIMKKAGYRPMMKRYSEETLPDRELAIHAALALWRADMHWFLCGLRVEESQKWIQYWLEQWQAYTDASIKIGMARMIRYIQEGLRNMPADSSLFKLGASWMMHAGSGSMAAFGMQLLDCRTDFEAQRQWMAMAHELLYRFTYTTIEKVRAIQLTPERVPAFAIAEIAFMVTLTSADRTVSATAAHCLRLFASAERQKGNAPGHLISGEEKAKRYPVYEQIGDTKALVLGRVADQKRIRKLMRLLGMPSPSHIAVWEECYWRWNLLNEMTKKSAMDPTPENIPPPNGYKSMTSEERLAQWQNLTLFLASFGAACLRDVHDPGALAAIIPLRYLPDQLRVLRDPIELLNNFISSLINLLLAETVQHRDVAREALSTEAHPRLYPRILRELNHRASVFLQIKEIKNGDQYDWDQLTIWLDQFLTIVKVIIENAQSGEEMRGIEIPPVLFTIASHIMRFPRNTALNRLKLKFCALADSFLDRMDLFSIRKDNLSRQGILDCMIEWTQEEQPATTDPEAIKTQQEANVAIIRTTVKLLDRLELQNSDEIAGDEVSHAISRRFMRYYSFLTKSFSRSEAEEDSLSDHTTFSQPKAGRDGDLRQPIIQGLASLISANPEFGIKQCLALTYGVDTSQRIIFAHVFARVIVKGINWDPKEASVQANQQMKLCELIKTSDPIVALTILEVCPPSEVDQIVFIMLNIFDTKSSLINLLKTMIDKEIKRTENEAAIFRSNSACARFIGAFAKVYGYNYVRSLVIPLVKTMASLPAGHGYEMDPAKTIGQDVKENQRNLEFVASTFLEILASSIPAFPPIFREVCAHLGKTVNEVWPESKFAALGAFMFLRFIGPAIVRPETIDVEAPTDAITRRGLMNIAKIMQNLANNIFFGKEMHMTALNDFLRANIVNVTRYLSEINKCSINTEEDHDEWLDTQYDETDNIVLHRFFERHADKVGKELLASSKPMTDDVTGEPSTGAGKKAWNAICNVLIENAPYLEIPVLSQYNSREHPEYLDLMSRYFYKGTSSVHHLFVPGITPQDHPAVFVFQIGKIDVEVVDFELLLFYIFKTLTSAPYEHRPFDIIVDWTSSPPSSQLPLHWVKFALEVLPTDIHKRLRNVRNLMPNAVALKYMRSLYNVMSSVHLSITYTKHTSVRELLSRYPESTTIPALAYAIDLENEPYEEFDEVFMRNHNPLRAPVIVHVARSHISIISMRTTQIGGDFNIRATEIIPLAEISDIYNVSTGHDSYEFIIRKNRHGNTLYFSSPNRDIIAKAIRAAKGSMKNIQLPTPERFLKISSVISSLLHIGMLSANSENEELRIAAYELLCSICAFLDFEGKPVVPTKATFVPGHAGSFVIQLSEKLAAFAPQLTLDFIAEVSASLDKIIVPQRITCLQYMNPWIKSLACFTDPTNSLFEHSGTKVRDCIRTLIDLTMSGQEIHSVLQRYIWVEIGRLDSQFVNSVLDELMRAAVEGGLGSQRCELIADTMSSITSINVRGRLLARLRKVLGKTSMKPTKSLADNVYWNEIACLIRLLLVANYLPRNSVHAQLYIPEICHLVTLLAGSGQLLVRTSIYGIIINLLQSVYQPKPQSGDAPAVGPGIKELLDECADSETLTLFGLARPSPTSDYTVWDPPSDRVFLENLEKLSQLLTRLMEVISGNRGLLNVWRARWMSLITSSAFQLSPAIQTRAFLSLCVLATSEVDDDLLYQMLVAFKIALSQFEENDTTAVVSMLRSIRQVVPALTAGSRYLPQLFWLAVALLQSSHVAVYVEAIQLLRVSVEIMAEQGVLTERGLVGTLLEAREPLESTARQLDQILGLTFQSNFSYSLASIIFKGIRQQTLKDSAEATLRTLLRVTVATCVDHSHNADDYAGVGSPLCPDVMGYFIALLPVSTTTTAFRTVLGQAGMDPTWTTDEVIPQEEDDEPTSKVPFRLLGIDDATSALYLASFASAVLVTAQGDDTETEMLFNILSEIADEWPDVICTCFESLQDKIRDAFTFASNPAILSAVSNIFKIAMQDPRTANASMLRASSSTLSTVDELNGSTQLTSGHSYNVYSQGQGYGYGQAGHGPGRNHISALNDLGMHGLANSFQFLPAGRGQATKMINWIAELVQMMIE